MEGNKNSISKTGGSFAHFRCEFEWHKFRPIFNTLSFNIHWRCILPATRCSKKKNKRKIESGKCCYNHDIHFHSLKIARFISPFGRSHAHNPNAISRIRMNEKITLNSGCVLWDMCIALANSKKFCKIISRFVCFVFFVRPIPKRCGQRASFRHWRPDVRSKFY